MRLPKKRMRATSLPRIAVEGGGRGREVHDDKSDKDADEAKNEQEASIFSIRRKQMEVKKIDQPSDE